MPTTPRNTKSMKERIGLSSHPDPVQPGLSRRDELTPGAQWKRSPHQLRTHYPAATRTSRTTTAFRLPVRKELKELVADRTHNSAYEGVILKRGWDVETLEE
jgi:hypothetical protein